MNHKIALKAFASISISCFIAGCHSNRAESLTSRSLREIKSPAASGTFSPNVTSRSDGSVILSWLEPQGDTVAALRFSVWRDGAWSSPITILRKLMYISPPLLIAASIGHLQPSQTVQELAKKTVTLRQRRSMTSARRSSGSMVRIGQNKSASR
jgi:hypothetical protein